MLNGAWLLPKTEQHAVLLNELAETVKAQAGTAVVFTINEPSATEAEGFVARFQADRGREFSEFAERCEEFLAEIEKETRRRKFTFAELEEIEDDLEKLTAWLAKIQARDFFPNEESQRAKETLERCGGALKVFAEAVYAHEGVSSADENAEKPGTP